MGDPKVANLMTLDMTPMVAHHRAAITAYLKTSSSLPKNEAYALMTQQARARLEMLSWIEASNTHTMAWAARRQTALRDAP
jgi:hypothetical protein